MTADYRRLRSTVTTAMAADRELQLRAGMAPAMRVVLDALTGGNLLVTDLKLTKNTVKVLELSGKVVVAGLACRATLAIRDAMPPEVVVVLEPTPATVALAQLSPSPASALGALVGALTATTAAGPDLQLRKVRIEIASTDAAVTVTAATVGKAPISVANRKLEVTGNVRLHSQLDNHPTGPARATTVTLGAALRVAGQTIALEADLGSGTQAVTGRWDAEKGKTLSVSQLLGGLRLPKPALPEGLDPTLTSLVLTWDQSAGRLRAVATSATVGSVTVVAQRTAAGTWQHAVTLDVAAGTKPSDLPVVGPALTPVDVFTFQRLSVVVASHDLTIRATDGTLRELAAGANLVGTIDLTGGDAASTQLATTVGTTTLDVSLALEASATTLTASLGGQVDLGGGLALTDPYVGLGLRPPSIEIGGALLLDAGALQLTAAAAVKLEATQISGRFFITAQTPTGEPANLLEPLGIRGVSLSGLGMSVGIVFAPPSATLGLQANFGLGTEEPGSSTIAIVVQVLPTAPIPTLTVMAVHFAVARLTLGVLLEVFTESPPTLPAPLADLEARDLDFLYGQQPTTLPDGTPVPQGFRFRGELDLFGFAARADVAIDAQSGARGRFDVAAIDLRLGDVPVVRLTRGPDLPGLQDAAIVPAADARWADGPYFRFTSRGPKFLQASAELELFGFLRRSVVVEVGSDGMRFTTELALGGIASTSLTCAVQGGDAPSFHGAARVDLDLDVDVPIVIGDLDLGHLRLDAELHAAITIDASPQAFTMTIACDFEFEGTGFDFTITLDVPLTALTDLATLVVDWIIEHAGELFADLFDVFADAWNAATAEITAFADAIDAEIDELVDDAEALVAEIGEDAKVAAAAITGAAAEAGVAIDAAAAEARRVVAAATAEVAKVGDELIAFGQDVDATIHEAVARADAVATAAVAEVTALAEEVTREVRALAASVATEVTRLLADAQAVADRIWDETVAFVDDLREKTAAVVAALEREARLLLAEAARIWDEIEGFLEDVEGVVVDGVVILGDTAEVVGDTVVEGATIVGEGVVTAGTAVGGAAEDAWDWATGWI